MKEWMAQANHPKEVSTLEKMEGWPQLKEWTAASDIS